MPAQKEYVTIKGKFEAEDRTVPLKILKKGATQDGFNLSGTTQLVIQFPKQGGGKFEKALYARKQLSELTVGSVKNSTVYSGKVDGNAFTYTSDSTATEAEIVAALIAAIHALPGVTAAAGLTSNKIRILGDVAGTAFVISDLTTNLTSETLDAALPAGGVVIDDQYTGSVHVVMTDSDQLQLKEGDKQTIEAVHDVGTTRRIIQFLNCFTVKPKVVV